MAGYVIHLAVAKEFARKYPNEINNYNDYIDGVIYPDNVLDKSITHYGQKSSKVNLKEFISKNNLETDFNKGYFIHLLTDYIFYNHFLCFFSKNLYIDYDILNAYLVEKFDIDIPDSIKSQIFYKDGLLHILSLDTIIYFIDKVSNYDINVVKKEILEDVPYWSTFKNLIKI